MKIVYVGPLWYGSTALQRAEGLKELGHEVTYVDTETEHIKKKKRGFAYRVKRKLLGPSDIGNINGQILEIVRKDKFDILWIDKGLTIRADTLREFKRVWGSGKSISYSPDDMMNPHNQSKQYMECISEYDLHVTTKSYNVEELMSFGAKDVYFIQKAYCPKLHRPVSLSDSEKKYFGSSVGFIGAYEKERGDIITFLSERGIHVKVWGDWPRLWGRKSVRRNVELMGRSLWGDEYVKVLCSTDINLGFLRKCNRDLHTQRSVEIPACGSFMLAERTDEHLSLFREGVEADFFSSNDELLGKIIYYLKNHEKRNAIAQAGYERCVKGGYSNYERLRKLMTYTQKTFFL